MGLLQGERLSVPAIVSEHQCTSPRTLPVAVVTTARAHKGRAALCSPLARLLLAPLLSGTPVGCDPGGAVRAGSSTTTSVPISSSPLEERGCGRQAEVLALPISIAPHQK